MTNEAPIDRWTVVHALTGAATGYAGVHPAVAALGAVAYEAIEWYHEHPHGSALFGTKQPESVQNILADLTIWGAMYTIGRERRRRIGRRASRTVAIATSATAAVLSLRLREVAG